jgi:hypothetical protein
VSGFGFLLSGDDRPYFLPLSPDSDSYVEIPSNQRWQFLFEFLELKSTIKICYDLKRCILPFVAHSPNFTGIQSFFVPLIFLFEKLIFFSLTLL